MRTAWLALALVYPAVAAWAYFVLFAGDPRAVLAWTAAKVGQAAIPLVGWAALREPWPDFRSGRDLGILAGLATGAALAAAIAAAWLGLGDAGWLAEARAGLVARLVPFGALGPLSYAALALGIALLHSLLEEVYWRGYVLGALLRRTGPRRAIAASSLGFAAHHVVLVGALLGRGAPVSIVLAIAAGVGAAGALWAVQSRRRSLAAAWASHAVADLAVFGVGFRLVWP